METRVVSDDRQVLRAGDEAIATFGDESWVVKVLRVDLDNQCIVEPLFRWEGELPREPMLPAPRYER